MRIFLIFLWLSSSLFASNNLSQKVFKVLNSTQKLKEEKKFIQALDLINKSLENSKNKIDVAYLLQSKAYLLISTQKYKQAIENFEKMLALKVMQKETTNNTRFNIAQLYISIKKYQKATLILERWIKETKTTKPEVFILLAQSYSLQKKAKQAISHIKTAIKHQKNAKKQIPLSWYELAFSNYYQLKNYPKAITMIKAVLHMQPKNSTYWNYLAQMYVLNKQPKKAMNYFEQGYLLDLFKEKEIVQFSYFLLQNKLYYKAATILEKYLNQKEIQPSEANLKLIFESYTSAKEYKKALKFLEKLIVLKQGKYTLRKARLLNITHQPQSALQVYEEILEDKNLKDRGTISLEAAYLYYELKEYKQCIKLLKIASKDKKTGKLAQDFLRKVEAFQKN